MVTKGNSLVNDTINYTTHPSLDEQGLPVTDATKRLPLSVKEGTNVDVYREHRFDCDGKTVKYFLNGKQMHEDNRAPKLGGNLQLKLWADGNMWWSGKPSTSTVTMSVKSITAYFNVTGGATEERCEAPGGADDNTLCEADIDN